MLEYILFKCRERDSKHYEYLPILKRSWENRYLYYRISFIPRKKLTKNIIRRLSSLSLIEFMGSFASDNSYFDYYYKDDSYCIVYNYKIIIESNYNLYA